MNQRLCRLLALPIVAAFLNAMLLPAVASAQDGFDFDEEEVEDFGEPMDFGDDDWSDDGWEADDGHDANTDDGWGETDTAPAVVVRPDTVTGIIVPSSTLAPELANQLTSALLTQLGTIEGAVVVDNTGLRDEFEIMGAELAFECAFDPVCLGRYGRQLGLGRIVVGRVATADGGNWATTIDLFETTSSSITNYRYFETEPRILAVQEALPEQLNQLFGIRAERVTTGTGRTGPSTAQVALAWTTAGLAVASVATGVVFGLSAKSAQTDLEDCPLVDDFEGEPVCEMRQVEAQTLIDDGKSDARLSNILIGGGVFLGVLSVVLFTVTPGGDIDENADIASRPRREWRLSPAVSRQGFGITGAWQF